MFCNEYLTQNQVLTIIWGVFFPKVRLTQNYVKGLNITNYFYMLHVEIHNFIFTYAMLYYYTYTNVNKKLLILIGISKITHTKRYFSIPYT
jgi:hypothetical protein